MSTYIYILICIAGGCVEGQQIKSSRAYFTKSSCEQDARLIARNMYYPEKHQWGYKCVELDFEPKKLD